MAETAWNYRDIIDYVDSITFGSAKSSLSEVSQQLQDLRPSFINLLRYKVCFKSNLPLKSLILPVP